MPPLKTRFTPNLTTGFRILVVDDDEELRRSLKESLEKRLGGRVMVATAADAQEARSILARDPHFDVVLSDERMPGMRGVEFLVWVRENVPAAARVLMTGLPDETLREEARERADVALFIKKPDLASDLARIESLLKKPPPV